MGYQPAPLPNLRSGLVQDVEPFLLPDDGSPSQLNIQYFRGRLVEKGGETIYAQNYQYPWQGRLGARYLPNTAHPTAVTDGSGHIPSGTVFNAAGISPGTCIIKCGTISIYDKLGDGVFQLLSGAWAGSGAIDNATGTISSTVTGLPATTAYTVYFLVIPDANSTTMGLSTRNIAGINKQELFGFDLLKPYNYSSTNDRFELIDEYSTSATGQDVITFNGTETDFFWTANYQDGFFVTNNVYGFPGRQDISAVTITVGPDTHTTIDFTNPVAGDFVVGDTVFVWDFGGVTFATGSAVITAVGASNITILDISTGTWTSGGTVQNISRQIGSGDGIKFYDPSGWHNFCPPVTGQNPPFGGTGGTATYLLGFLMLFPYKGFMVSLNTWEGLNYGTAINRAQRARWSQNGTVYYSDPVPTNQTSDPLAWSQSTGRGGFIDAPTQEQIVSAGYIRDTLVVFFESSTWILDFTEDLFLPFVWRQVNNNYGSQSTFGTIPFDRGIYAISENGWIITDGVNLERFDQKIPDLIYESNQSGTNSQRVQAQLNFVGQNMRWCYPEDDATYPNQELVYNYLDKSWTINQVYHTAFSKFELFNYLIWADMDRTWEDTNITWAASGTNTGNSVTIGGNSQGFILEIPSEQVGLQTYNDVQFSVTGTASGGLITVPNHPFYQGTEPDSQFIYLTGLNPSSSAYVYNNQVFAYSVVNASTLELFDVNDVNPAFTGTGDLLAAFISCVDNFVFYSKRFYGGGEQGLQCRLGYIDFLIEPTATNVLIQVDLFIDEFTTPSQTTKMDITSATGSGQQKIWKRVFFNSMGTAFQFKLSYPVEEIFALDRNDPQFILHQFTPWFKQGGRMVRQPVI